MSAKIMGKVWELELPANKLIVLLAMADHADHDGNNVYPSMDLIAWKTGYSEKQVRRIVKAIEKDGLLKCEKRSGGRVPHRFSIHLENGKLKAPREIKPSQNVQDGYTKPSQDVHVSDSQPTQIGLVQKPQPGHFAPPNLDIQMSTKPSREPKDKDKSAQPARDGFTDKIISLFKDNPPPYADVKAKIEEYGFAWVEGAIHKGLALPADNLWRYTVVTLEKQKQDAARQKQPTPGSGAPPPNGKPKPRQHQPTQEELDAAKRRGDRIRANTARLNAEKASGQ